MNPPTTTVQSKPTFGFGQLIRTVLSGMFGIRGRKNHEQDMPALKPIHIIATAIIFMAIFVTTIVTLATWVAGK